MSGNTETHIYTLQKDLIGRRYAGATLASIALGERGTSVINWIKKGENFLIYLGAPGVGKTYFCSALFPWIYGKFSSFRYWNERDFLSRIRSVISQDKGDYLKEMDYLIDDQFLIFDDLGSSGINDWRKEVLFELIDRRYESQKPTVITSNLTKEEIYKQLGARSHSRMFSKENLILEFHDAEDVRQKEKINANN